MSCSEALQADQSGETPSIKTENDVKSRECSLPVQTVEENDKLPWCIGDIVWSKIPGHPWWPSLIAHEPNTEVYFKMKGRTKYYHVQFFGTEALRGWVTERNVLKYQGKPHFLSLRLSVHGKPHKIGTKQLPAWENAINLADKALPLSPEERQECFTFLKFKIPEPPNTEMEQGVNNASGVLEDKTSNSALDSHEKVLTENGEPLNKKARIDHDTGKQNLDCVEPSSVCTKNNALTFQKEAKTTSKKQVKNKVDKRVKKGLAKQVTKTLSKHVKNKLEKQIQDQFKKKCVIVNDSSTSCTVQMSMDAKTPVNGKRKRGRPRKDLVFNVKKGKTDKCQRSLNTIPDNIASPSVESEKSDGTSDSNSISSVDIESRKSLSKTREYVCAVCEKPDNVLICEGICHSAYHKDCLSSEVPTEKFVCDQCKTGNHTCFVCSKTDNVIKCSSLNCGKFYHLDCIKTVNPKITGENFICPLHHCNVCGTSKSTSSKRRLTCCTRCPVAYHSATCIVAGSMPITSQYLVCNRHFMADPKKAHHSHVNVNWCFVCSIGGILICCESCPAAFHAECIEETGIPEGRFFCRDCKDGKELLYGEIVWVKLGMYRWWPAQICNPNNIPSNIQRMKHQPGEFPVQFLGSHDYYWIHRGRVFSYQEGDKGSIGSGGKYLAEIFKKALVEAQEKYADWQKAQEEKAEKDLEKLSKKPAVYKHIKVNRYTTATRYEIDESEWSTCDCSISDENPCGPDSHCLNRILYVECSPLKCPAKEKCQNQCFVKRQYLDCEPFRAERRGWGLKAKADAKKGQFVIEYVGELISDETCRERVRKGINDGVINYYMLTIDKDCIIDAGPMGNLSRFMNHSCDPNCETQKWTVNGEVRVGLFAKRDIKTGEELVFDYQLDCLGNEKKKCSCGSENCSGFLGVRPKTQHALKLQEEKKKNQDSKKKKKKTGNKKPLDEHEDECFDCGDGGELIMCSKTGCSKCYHLSCLTIDKIPHGDWLCPWHFCDDCGKAAVLRCQECSNSFCLAHAPGQITKMVDGRYLCDQHPDSSDASQENAPGSTPGDPNTCGSTPRDPNTPGSTPGDLNTPGSTPGDPNTPGSTPGDPNTPGSTPGDPMVKSEDPTDRKVLIHPASVSPNAIEEFPNPGTVSADPNHVSMDPSNSPTNPTNVSSSPTTIPINIPRDPSDPTNTPICSSAVPSNLFSALTIPTNVSQTSEPMNPTSELMNPTSEAENAINTLDDSNLTQENLAESPNSVAEHPVA